jgi:hypothetical protein
MISGLEIPLHIPYTLHLSHTTPFSLESSCSQTGTCSMWVKKISTTFLWSHASINHLMSGLLISLWCWESIHSIANTTPWLEKLAVVQYMSGNRTLLQSSTELSIFSCTEENFYANSVCDPAVTNSETMTLICWWSSCFLMGMRSLARSIDHEFYPGVANPKTMAYIWIWGVYNGSVTLQARWVQSFTDELWMHVWLVDPWLELGVSLKRTLLVLFVWSICFSHNISLIIAETCIARANLLV